MESSIRLVGVVTKGCEYDYEGYGLNFYKMEIAVERRSGVVDRIPLMLTWKEEIGEGERVEVYGTVRTADVQNQGKKKLRVYVYVDDIGLSNESDFNEVQLVGRICKKSELRVTPFKKKICDIILAVDKKNGSSVYIPCIFWAGNARYISELDIQTEIALVGRLQSRNYIKEGKTYTAIEVSATEFCVT